MKQLGEIRDTCPTCGGPLDSSAEKAMKEAEEVKYEEATRRIKTLQREIVDIKSENTEYERCDQQLRKIGKICTEAIDRSLQTDLLDQQELESRVSDVQGAYESQSKSLSRIAEENERITRRNTRIQVIQEQTDEFIAQLEEYSEKLDKES